MEFGHTRCCSVMGHCLTLEMSFVFYLFVPHPTLSLGNGDPVTVSVVLPLTGCCGWKRSPHELSSGVAVLLAILLTVTKESFRRPTPLSAFGSAIVVSACFKCSSLELGCGSSFLDLFFHVVLL